jgi:hypothetical protein
MGQEADADEQLRRRLRRVFAAEERSFRMDRRSQAATALRASVADVLPRFLGTYSDDTLAVPPRISPSRFPRALALDLLLRRDAAARVCSCVVRWC